MELANRKRLPALVAIGTMAIALPIGIRALGGVDVHRLYNPYSGEHFFTTSVNERNKLEALGWQCEGVGWVSPRWSPIPVHRLYGSRARTHAYVVGSDELHHLIESGWRYESIAWYADPVRLHPVYRVGNPNSNSGDMLTMNKLERDRLVQMGWQDEGIAWYGMRSAR